jgi:hypothetical protein
MLPLRYDPMNDKLVPFSQANRCMGIASLLHFLKLYDLFWMDTCVECRLAQLWCSNPKWRDMGGNKLHVNQL